MSVKSSPGNRSFRQRIKTKLSRSKSRKVREPNDFYAEQLKSAMEEQETLNAQVDRLGQQLKDARGEDGKRVVAVREYRQKVDDFQASLAKRVEKAQSAVNAQCSFFGCWICSLLILPAYSIHICVCFAGAALLLFSIFRDAVLTGIDQYPVLPTAVSMASASLAEVDKESKACSEDDSCPESSESIMAPSPISWPAFGTEEYLDLKRKYIKSQTDALDSKQLGALEQMREAFKDAKVTEVEQNIGTFEMDDLTFLRFLRARDYDVKKATTMLNNHVEWRNKIIPASVHPRDIARGLKSGISRRCGFSRTGAPIILVEVKNFNTSDFKDTTEFIKLCAFFFETSVREMSPQREKGLIFFDMAGFSLYRHWNAKAIRLISAFINIVQDQNPERLEKLILFNTPGIFRIAWKVIKGMVDANVQDKILFVTDLTVLRDEVDPANLNVRYGGDKEDDFPIDGLNLLEEEVE
eukprot:CAMPEP_0203797650 /NCGR_PEP_ID=MMETSP0100_2-20121128/8763_1 /ASSEMBLY_ACC=CAM_ASM_000210 /TAXON_ID=96639 /ORGANISM=" , Strain NY0313808BC1" /LENGTH=466 /DNA_ID=CAMNT_0050703013 /DNA_START=523 /DNA_END=1920 /DNA_ORIENTATION=+